MRRILNLLMCMPLLVLAACDIHEWPQESTQRVPFTLHLDFSREMPLYKEVAYTRSSNADTKGEAEGFDIRYVINAYRATNSREENRQADTTFVFTKGDLDNLNYSAPLELREGTYTFRVWADYVDAGSKEDKFYNTDNFVEIILADENNHVGSTDYRDAFRGFTTATVIDPKHFTGDIINTIDNSATVQMMRPMGKYKFISTDVEAFKAQIVEMMQKKEREKLLSGETVSDADSKAAYDQLLQSIDMSEYKVVFHYNPFMPCSFNMFTDKPADSWVGTSYTSRMFSENATEMTLGFDYIFVNGSETTLGIYVEVYNKEGERMSATNPINVPIVRSKLTVVKGEFLTSKASGGITITPGYDGDFDVPLPPL